MKTDSIPALIGITAVLIVLGFAPGVVEAGANQWHSLGPDGGFVSTLVVNPVNPLELYASYGSVYRTTDGGISWHRRSRGLDVVGQVVIDPQRPDHLVAVGSYGTDRGIFLTDNGGVDWRAVDLGSAEPSGRMYASSDDFVLFIARVEAGAMLTSLDRGETWSETELPPGARLRAVHPGDPSRFLVRIEDDLAITSDGGGSWLACGERPPISLRSVYFDPHNQDTIFVTLNGGGLMVSEDSCRSWSVRSELGNNSGIITLDPIRPDTVYSSTYEQLFRSTDGGFTWAEFGPANTRVWVGAMAFPEGQQEMMYLVATGDDEKRGVMFSGDGGASWQLRMGGFCTQTAWNLLIHPEDPDHLIAGIREPSRYWGNGLYRSENNGVSWTFIDGTEGFGPAVAMGLSVPDILYTTSSERAIMRSIDFGVSWTEMGQAPNNIWIGTIEVDPLEPATLYATDMEYENAFRSDDGGRSWTELEVVLGSDQQYIDSVRPDPHDANVIYAGLWEGGVARSSDRGQSWQDGRQGLETTGVCAIFGCGRYWTILDVAIDPSDPSRVFGLSSIGPFRSTDAGETWQLVREGLKVCCQLDHSWSEEGCPGYQGKGPSKLSYSPPTCLGSPNSIAFDPTDSNVVYLTADGATYRSRDGGETWLRIDNRVGGAVAFDIHVVQEGVLLGASWGSGVVRFDVEEIPAPRNGGGRSGQP